MEYVLSLAFTLIDILCMVFFLDAFATRRWTGVRFWAFCLHLFCFRLADCS